MEKILYLFLLQVIFLFETVINFEIKFYLFYFLLSN